MHAALLDDILLSLNNPYYKAIILDMSGKIQSGEISAINDASNEVFDLLKDKGGRLFKLKRYSETQYEVDDREARGSE